MAARKPTLTLPGRTELLRYAQSSEGLKLALLLDEMRPPLRPWRWVDRSLSPMPAERAHQTKETIRR